MTETLTLKERTTILFKAGFLRFEDRDNVNRIEARWQLYQNVPQKTVRGAKEKPDETPPRKPKG